MSKNDNVTVDRRVAEEELCWKELEKARAAKEAENAAQMQAMFESMDNSGEEGDWHDSDIEDEAFIPNEEANHSYLDISEPADRTLRRMRRRGELKAKKKAVRDAAEASANAKAREEHDKQSSTQRDRGTGEKVGHRKSQVSRQEKLVKKAKKVGHKK